MNRYLTLVITALFAACGGTTATDSTTTTTGLRLTAAADFASSASAALSKALAKATTAQCAEVAGSGTEDSPELADGLDCDGDGGIVAHITPSTYSVAFKRVTLEAASGGTDIDLIADKGTLANAQVVDFTSADSTETIITIDPNDLTAGTYTGVSGEIYYIQMTFLVGETTRHVRTYLSDDDFPAEGSLGHHQGDITFIDDNGTETGWIDSTWIATTTTRGDEQNGAGGTDAETGHERGYFGNTTLWNASVYQQGATQDLYVFTLDFTTALTIPAAAEITDLTTVTATFSTADTFYYEDFAPQGTGFFPASGGEATAETTGWAPLEPEVSIAVTTGA